MEQDKWDDPYYKPKMRAEKKTKQLTEKSSRTKNTLNAMSEYAQQEATAFAEWMRDNHYIHNSLINKDGKFWFRQYTSPDKRELHTTEQLYQIYKSQP